ncbi:extracellular solute-binding protein [Paenibacillus alkaliterrae]|uniref:ABC transporter substrate-binding protein n=1 Tax=Paenibacillus alkaliterrae TaxID=320909 RepID=UPI001F295E03|nr:extracellular solute-binding protein [Paenibacillus alkaliterrae]MCF2936949.1 extracellular solute-binding protein [Paenibacillus alkaliterrae]
MVKKNRLSFLMTMLLFVSVFTAACGSNTNVPANTNGNSSNTENAATDEKVTISILSRASGTSPTAVAFQNLLKKFMDENPNITVVDESLNDENAFNNKLKTSLATGNVPNIWTNYGGEAFKEYATNIALNLQPYLDEDPEWSGAFLPLFDTWQYKDVKGTYGVPTEFYSIAIYYNKELFEKIGMSPPTTIEEMSAVADKFKEIGITPMAIADKENFRGGHMLTNLSLKKFGQSKTEALVTDAAKWNDPDMTSLLQLMKDWQTAGILGNNIVTTDNNTITANFIAGKSAMLYEGSWGISQLAESAIADKIGVIPFPAFADAPETKDLWFGGAGGYSVSKEAKGAELDATIKLVKFLTSVESFQYYLEFTKGGVYPVKMEIAPDAVDPITQAFAAAQASASGFKGEIYAYDPIAQLQDKVRNEIQGMFAGNSPQIAADAIQSFVQSNRK